MVLFLSKLLPLFVYPLGLSCICLAIALILIWQKKRRGTAIAVAAALMILLVGSNGWVATQVVKSLEWRYLPATPLPNAEAIVVLGGGVKPAIPPRPWVDLAEGGDRIIHGVRLYQAGKAPLLVLSGGRIPWQGGGPPESGDMAAIAAALGVPSQAIWQDPDSLNTYENAVNVRELLESRGIRRILLVTSAMHMPRSLAIFQKQGFEAIAAPTDFLISEQEIDEPRTTLAGQLLALIPQSENLQDLTRALKEYIGFVIYRLRGWL
ncbi:hypothetical protein C7271_05525 [filamentous cyanobacterium CCP5]|nr:hypothetical protein C7271_05525 [filamentous cyanobacterium CCP5]